jgi:hypothetical protein
MIKTMTPCERRAVRDYEFNISRIRHGYAGQQRRKLWAGELNRLEGAAAGSPNFDLYVDYASKRLAQFAAELAEATQ